MRPDPLLALEAALLQAEERSRAATEARDGAETRLLRAGAGLPQKPHVLLNGAFCTAPEELLARSRVETLGGAPDATRLLADYLRQQIALYQAARSALGLAALDAEDDDAYAALQQARRALTAAPSASLAGVAAKLRRLREEVSEGASDLARGLTASALADIERFVLATQGAGA
jgi:hypothetical protein